MDNIIMNDNAEEVGAMARKQRQRDYGIVHLLNSAVVHDTIPNRASLQFVLNSPPAIIR